MTLHFEVLRPGSEEVVGQRVFQPGEGSTIANNLPDGSRELFMYGCSEDNSYSIIEKSSNANDLLLSRTERFVPVSTEFTEVARLFPDQSYTLQTVTDRGTRADVRFTHRLP